MLIFEVLYSSYIYLIYFYFIPKKMDVIVYMTSFLNDLPMVTISKTDIL